MRGVLSAAVLAALVCSTTAAFKGEIASIFTSWDTSRDAILVDDFDHVAQSFHPQVQEEEHIRRKRNAEQTARFASGSPITRKCEVPGYTGQYCEFPICESFNPSNNPQQFLGDEGYAIDLTELFNCTQPQKIIIDDTLYDIRIEIQSLEDVSPTFTIVDADGNIGYPDRMDHEPDRYIETFSTLPPGAYTVLPTASSTTSRCILSTTAQSSMTISGGFQTDERDRNDFPNENAGAHQFNSILLTLNGGRSPAILKTVAVVGPENNILRPRVLDKRYGCQYEFYFDSFFCYSRGSYALIVDGVDFNGNLFRRVAPFECVNTPAPSTSPAPITTPQPTNPTSCANGGVLLTNGDKTSCVCQDHWTGYDCSQALCVNGGTRLMGKCFCPIGFEGVHCEQVKCEPTSNHGFGVDRPTLVFVIRQRVNMNEIVPQIQKAIDEALSNIMFDPTYLTRFQLVLFNDHEIVLNKHYSSVKEFDSALLSAAASRDKDGGCYESVLEAVASAVSSDSLTQGSTVYVVTDGLADDYAKQIDAIVQLNSFARATINFIYVEPVPKEQSCSDVADPGFRAFEEVANRFGGLAWHVPHREKVYDVLYGHMNSILYKSQLMLTLDRDTCNNGMAKVMQVDMRTNSLVFISKGRDFHLELTTPEGTELYPQTVVEEGSFTVSSFSSLAGTYLIRTSSSSPSASCSLRAYQVPGKWRSTDQGTEAYWAITTNVDTDAVMYQPQAGTDNHPVFHVEPFREDVDHAFAFLNMYAVRDGFEQEVYASNGLFRGGCTFQFYFPSFRCRPNENLHYEFNLRDDNGFYIQRAGVMTCFNYVPTPSAPSDCQNGGVKYNETCLCQPHYEGEHCQNIICENGGNPVFDACQCLAGWTGPFCNHPQCPESGPLPSFGYHADMAFLVELSPKGVKQIQKLVEMMYEIVRDVRSHMDWIDRLVLIGYDYNGVVGMVDTPISQPKVFFDTLNDWSTLHPMETACRVQIWEALDALLNERKDGNKPRELPERSIVNVFEASVPTAEPDDPELITSISLQLLQRKAITNVFEDSDWEQHGGLPCGGQKSDFRYLEQIARRGDGMVYMLDNADLGQAVRMIPTLFSSSIVYKYHSDDCTNSVNVYFPLDAYTQTVTAVIAGTKPTVDLYSHLYVDAPFYQDGRVEILNDDTNLVVEFRNPCENDWRSNSQSCVYIENTVTKNFQDASDECMGMGGFLADDLNGDKTYFLGSQLGEHKGWLGLEFIDGIWYFQAAGGTIQVLDERIAQWAGREAPDGTTGHCAYFWKNIWYAADCKDEYVVMCQKPMFNGNNQASNLDDDDLAPGKYFLSVKTEPGKDEYKGCDVEVRVQSDLNVEFGFVNSLRKDTPQPIANVDSNENRLVSSINLGRARAENAVLQDVLLRTDDINSTLLEAATASLRIGCSYEFYSQPLSCDLTNGNDFSVVMIGEDDTGNTFQRYSTSVCDKWYVCKNGGVYSNGQCLCSDYFAGEECERPMCQNGGEITKEGTCSCPRGFGGPACQFVQCPAPSAPKFSNTQKSLVLLIEKSATMADPINRLASYIQPTLRKMDDRHPGWIVQAMVQTFTLDGEIDDVAYFYDGFALSIYLENLATDSKSRPGGCKMPIWKALHAIVASDFAPRYLTGSEVLIVSAAAPDDADLDAIQKTMEMFDIQSPIVDYIHVDTPECPVDDWKTDLRDFANFLSTTGGVVFRVSPTQIGTSLEDLLPTRYAPQRISYSDPLNCKDNDIYVQVDTGMTFVYILVGGPWSMNSLKVMDPNGEEISPTFLWNSEQQCFWTFSPKNPGIYKITINSSNEACFPVVYGSGLVMQSHPYAAQVFSGFVQHYDYLDTPKPFAELGVVNFPVFHVFEETASKKATQTLYMARISRQTIDGTLEESYTSDVDPRDGCSYSYIGKAFTCLKENDVITLSVSGVDSYNQPFTRQTTTYCKKPGSV